MDAMSMRKLTDKNGNDISAQQAYDAAMSGPVYAFGNSDVEGILSSEYFIALDLNCVIRENGNVASIVFLGDDNMKRYIFYAGENPNNIIGGGPR